MSLCEPGSGRALVSTCDQSVDGSSPGGFSDQRQWWIQMAVRQLCSCSRISVWVSESAFFSCGQFSKRVKGWGLSDGCSPWTWRVKPLILKGEMGDPTQGWLQSNPLIFGSWPATICTVSIKVYFWCRRVGSWEGLSLGSGNHSEDLRTVGSLTILTAALSLLFTRVQMMTSLGATCFGPLVD